MMDQLITKFPAQLKEALEIGEAASVRPHHFQLNKAIMCGMGGSGIGGAFVADIIADECTCPYIVNSSYTLPTYVDKFTLHLYPERSCFFLSASEIRKNLINDMHAVRRMTHTNIAPQNRPVSVKYAVFALSEEAYFIVLINKSDINR